MTASLIRLNGCPVLIIRSTIPLTDGDYDARLFARDWLLGKPLPDEVSVEEVTR